MVSMAGVNENGVMARVTRGKETADMVKGPGAIRQKMEVSLWYQVLLDIPAQGRKHVLDFGMNRCNIATKDNRGRTGGGGKGHLEIEVE